MRAGASLGCFWVYTPTKIWKACNHISMVRTFLGFGAGSKQKDTGWPASEFWKLIWYFFSREGLLNNEPNSTNASFQIFSFSLSETRESMGKLADWKNRVVRHHLLLVIAAAHLKYSREPRLSPHLPNLLLIHHSRQVIRLSMPLSRSGVHRWRRQRKRNNLICGRLG